MNESIDPADYLSIGLQRLDLLLHREILRLRARYQLSLDEFRGLYISDDQVNALINRFTEYRGDSSVIAELTQRAEALRLSGERVQNNRWRNLCAEFSLPFIEQDVLLLALAPEINLKYETLYAYLNNDVTRKWPTRDLALKVLASSADQELDIRKSLNAESNLFSNGLLQLISSTPDRPSWLASGFSASSTVLDYLWQAEDSAPSQTAQIEDLFDCLPVSPSKRVALRRISNFAKQDQVFPLIVFTGRDGLGQQVAAKAICSHLGMTLQFTNLAESRTSEDLLKLLQQSFLSQRLWNTGIYLERFDALFDPQGHPLPELSSVLRLFANSSRPTFISVESNTNLRELLFDNRALFVSFEAPDYDLRFQLWEKALLPVDSTISKADLEALADRFVLTPKQIEGAVRAALDEQTLMANSPASNHLTLDTNSLFAAARAQSDQSLGKLAVKVKTIHTFTDLVLPAATIQRIREIAAAIKFRHVVYSTWKFEERIASGKGLKTLFAGASGTGKTMTAGVIARELGLDLYKIDLSAIVSKYIGETEKNLDQIFHAAESSNAILFFDEADALFGKRSEVKSAHDRYANIEVAYLLQKIEEYEGVVILASNLSKYIDEAFSRRMHYVVEFPLPDEELRERLWLGMFPPQVPLAADVDFGFLARQFAIAGGDIRNVALDAAFLAAQDGEVVTMRGLIRSMARQMAKNGRVPAPTDFKQYHSLIAQDD